MNRIDYPHNELETEFVDRSCQFIDESSLKCRAPARLTTEIISPWYCSHSNCEGCPHYNYERDRENKV